MVSYDITGLKRVKLIIYAVNGSIEVINNNMEIINDKRTTSKKPM